MTPRADKRSLQPTSTFSFCRFVGDQHCMQSHSIYSHSYMLLSHQVSICAFGHAFLVANSVPVCFAADPVHTSSAAPPAPPASAQLVTYSSLPPMSPAMAAALPEQHPPRQRSVKWPVAASSSRTADQPGASPGRPTLLHSTTGPLSEASCDQVRASCIAACLYSSQ